ncbi:serine/threonine protein phosphatase inhibitor, endosulfine Igo1 [Schizosaccharomyces osmophilus]|uniref:mRNA stability protein n=1 Tax=Schizosaccharomyces osmophilus TaxID=2545709 RepID=A0AAE9WDF6_9SCHI|nr:serine/threonine protein phosphatase inhibitor, endosulfine Igo1 [Schizosaccharomyces osmophilus]WBW72668.1 serine/threonine protein phosphatase inhibitor, endosulfine Igo1 [Schizosaccharomyces osmophilus]
MTSGNPEKTVDITKLSPEEQKLFRLYGRLPQRKDLLVQKLQQGRKYFDSGDYALNKAGKASDAGITCIGKEIPSPETIPHRIAVTGSPSKEPSIHVKRPTDSAPSEVSSRRESIVRHFDDDNDDNLTHENKSSE